MLIKCYKNEANKREMAEKIESVEGQKIYKVRSKTVERIFGHIKKNIGLREFLTRGLKGVRAEFSLACIAHNLKRMWKIKGEMESIEDNSAKSRRFDRYFLKLLCFVGKRGTTQLMRLIGVRLAFMSGSLRCKAGVL